MAKHIGIVGCSAEGAALCYRTICLEGAAIMGEHAHPEITMHTYPLSDYTPFFPAGDWEGVARLMRSSAEKLAAAGAEFAICPDNTIHEAFDLVVKDAPIPWLHIAEEVAKEAENRGFSRLGILGTKFLMEGAVYPPRLESRGIAWQLPTPAERERINAIIFGDLVYGRFTKQDREYFNAVIGRLGDEGCDAVVLGCTEIPLLVREEESPLPMLDSTRILARSALREATK